MAKYLVKEEPYCRTCLSENMDGMCSIFENNLDVAVTEVTSIQLNVNDKFSKTICATCQFNALQSYEFRKRCQQVQKYLENLKPDVTIAEFTDPLKEEIDDSTVPDDEPPEPTKPRAKRQRSPRKKKNLRATRDDCSPNRTSARPWSCDICDKTFIHKRTYNDHMKAHVQYTCEIDTCQTICNSAKHLSTHMTEQHSAQAQFNCEYCPRTFVVQIEYERHLRSERARGFCDVCNVDVDGLRYHKRIEHCDLLLVQTCDACQRRFKSKRGFDAHVCTGDDSRKLKDARAGIICTICGLRFANIDKHIEVKHAAQTKADEASDTKPRTCRYCKQQFAGLSALFTHISNAHKRDQKHFFQCKQCPAKFTYATSLRRHISHLHEKTYEPFVCNVCGHASKTQQHSQNHMRVHTDERPFACDLCTRKFKSRNTLRDHRRTHTGERPHVCDVCHKGFTQRSALTTHARMHLKGGRGGEGDGPEGDRIKVVLF